MPFLPWFIWRGVVARRIRLLAGAMLAIWPGQVFFSGAIAQDNWVLLPAIALAALAVRRLCDPLDDGHPIASGLLLACAVAIRQEMALVLLPAALAAAASRRSWRRRAVPLTATVLAAILILATQRYGATGRFSIASEHGALGLFGSFVPGASGPGWIDARAYAEALEPGTTRDKLFGEPQTLVRLTVRELERRPVFHALRIASWPPRLAANADAENLFWSVEAPRALPAARQPAGSDFAGTWRPLLRLELAAISGVFAAGVLLGALRRDAAVLLLGSTVLLKLLIHAVVSPLARLAVPAVALELLTIAAAARLWPSSPRRARVAASAAAIAAAAFLGAAVPPIAAWIMRHDDRALPGVHRFLLRADASCVVRCELESGQIAGIAPTWVRLRAVEGGAGAVLRCSLPVVEEGERLRAHAADGNVSAEIARQIGDPSETVPVRGDGVDLDRGVTAVRFRLSSPPSSRDEATVSFE